MLKSLLVSSDTISINNDQNELTDAVRENVFKNSRDLGNLLHDAILFLLQYIVLLT